MMCHAIMARDAFNFQIIFQLVSGIELTHPCSDVSGLFAMFCCYGNMVCTIGRSSYIAIKFLSLERYQTKIRRIELHAENQQKSIWYSISSNVNAVCLPQTYGVFTYGSSIDDVWSEQINEATFYCEKSFFFIIDSFTIECTLTHSSTWVQRRCNGEQCRTSTRE